MENLKKKLLALDIVEDNEWLDRYCFLIKINQNQQRILYKTQRHHIIPRYYFNQNDIEIDNSKENIVNLFFKDHVLAHYYLALCSAKKSYLYSNLTYLNRITQGKSKDSIIEFADLLNLLPILMQQYTEILHEKRKLKHEEFMKQKELELQIWIAEQHTCETCGKVMTEKYGSGRFCCKSCAATHPHTEETKKLLSELCQQGICGRKGKKTSEESKKKHSKATKKYYENPEHRYRNMTKNGNDIRVPLDQVQKFLEDGYIIGQASKKGNPAWNKGLTQETDERVAKNIQHRNETMLEKYGTFNTYEIHKKKLQKD